MLIGVFWGYVAMIEGLVARMRAEIGRPGEGRSPPAASRSCSSSTPTLFDAVDPDLTLQGLAILVERAHIEP